ncbi:hypothetical protein GCM10022225_22100 [Plantactinospora mayteni]|uniref:Uncharacterized protein n=1 Tax=Plantactinospora mayteni TaxID=566021 RepID=A0ABQ4EP10_9ACTN|nr:hypothetical protein [Plantactinospora mayteni]GIG96392.1 hypothetical protein Pma05_29650 [Plantactinospora mayteni]
MSQAGELSDELPMPPYVTAEDVGFAVRAITVHASEQRPNGLLLCRNDYHPHPCRLHRWGQRVLAQRGLTATEITALVTRYQTPAAQR